MTHMDLNELLRKAAEAKKSGTDLSTEEDLSIAVMHLISLEEHFFFTAEKTGKREYFDLLDETRNMRKELLAKMIERTEGETWCVSKHLLGGTMRLIETGTKLRSQEKTDEAQDMFDTAYRLYSLFWAIRLKLISIPEAGKEKPWTKDDILGKLVDCCKE